MSVLNLPNDGLPNVFVVLFQSLSDVLALILREAGGPPEGFPFGFRPGEASLGTLDQEVALEFSYGIDHVHRQLAGRAGEIDTAQGQAMNPYTDAGKPGDGAADIHGIAAEAVKFRDHEDVAGFEPVEKAGEPPALRSGDATRNRLGHDATWLDLEAGSLNLLNLVVGRLADGRDADIRKGTCHGQFRPEGVSGI